MIVLETLSYKTRPKPDVLKRHRDFLRDKGGEGKIMMAGKFASGEGGLVVWKTDSLDNAERMAREDPFSKEGVSEFTLSEWILSFDYTAEPPIVS